MTVNNVRDGENVYRGILTNENASIPADSAGVVSSYDTATTQARLKYGSQEITDFKLITTYKQLKVRFPTHKAYKLSNVPNLIVIMHYGELILLLQQQVVQL